ncbi:MAG: hypothetical protein Q9160_005547 [Pyrenula sp. 1 TL-2023]
MDGLRTLARHDLDRKCTFAEEDSRDQINGSLSLITVSGSSGSESSHQVRQVSETMMLRELEDSRPAKDRNDAKASLTLAVMTRETGGHICISKRAFLRILKLFHIDPYVLHLISFSTAGFHHDPTPYESSYTYYSGTFTYLLTWSFDPSTMRTCGILLPWKSLWTKLNLDPVQDFDQVLKLYDRRLYTPFLLVFVILLHLTRNVDDLISHETAIIRQTEAANLHGQLPKIRVGIDQLSDFARILEDSLGHLCDLSRHLNIAESLVDFIEKRSQLVSGHHQTPPGMHSNYDEDLASFGSVFINQAEASYAVAEAAKLDASSMRTIAIMTMAFLPATFFAALFAVPSLKWDRPGNVIQRNFWIYWAFTIPATVIVFAAWLVLTKGSVQIINSPKAKFRVASYSATSKMEGINVPDKQCPCAGTRRTKRSIDAVEDHYAKRKRCPPKAKRDTLSGDFNPAENDEPDGFDPIALVPANNGVSTEERRSRPSGSSVEGPSSATITERNPSISTRSPLLSDDALSAPSPSPITALAIRSAPNLDPHKRQLQFIIAVFELTINFAARAMTFIGRAVFAIGWIAQAFKNGGRVPKVVKDGSKYTRDKMKNAAGNIKRNKNFER